MKYFLIILLILLCSSIQAQSFGKKLGKSVENAAQNATIRKAEQKTDQAVSKTIDKVTDPNTYKEEDKAEEQKAPAANESSTPAVPAAQPAAGNTSADAAPAASSPKAMEIAWSKFDFVAGDEIIFEDVHIGEKQGEFPSQWDVTSGSAEIVSIGGENAIEMLNRGRLVPLMENPKNYLPDMFTIELDIYYRDSKVKEDNSYGGDWVNGSYYITFYDANGKDCFWIRLTPQTREWRRTMATMRGKGDYQWKVGGENRSGTTQELVLTTEDWHHFSFSFNQRAMKVYLDQTRLLNIPNMDKPAYFQISAYTDAEKLYFIRNVRVAKGAVPLYDRMMTDGKFITYGITFDVGKSTIKPESMGEINRIVQLMNENPTLKFSVEGHTDATGNAANNQTLSEARSQAIVAKLVEMGISVDRMAASGKGQNNPIADNGTDEGRAKNRRVEFVRI